jgi:hypothetical protein
MQRRANKGRVTQQNKDREQRESMSKEKRYLDKMKRYDEEEGKGELKQETNSKS